jgi:hypothetical protein
MTQRELEVPRCVAALVVVSMLILAPVRVG